MSWSAATVAFVQQKEQISERIAKKKDGLPLVVLVVFTNNLYFESRRNK